MVDVRELLPVGQGRRGEFITQDAPIRRLLEQADRVAKATCDRAYHRREWNGQGSAG